MVKRCDACVHFTPGNYSAGWCQRYPPVLVSRVQSDLQDHAQIGTDVTSEFPIVEPGEFCGEWTPIPAEASQTVISQYDITTGATVTRVKADA